MDTDALKKMTVSELREMAKKVPGVKGISAMKKDELIELLADQAPAEKTVTSAKSATKSKPAAVTGVPRNRSEIKQRIRALKEEKREALSRQDRAKAKDCNRKIHEFKRRLRKMAGSKAQKK